MGRSRGGLTTKIHALVDANGLPIRLKLTAGQAHDGRGAADMFDTINEGDVLLAHRAYDADALLPVKPAGHAHMPPGHRNPVDRVLVAGVPTPHPPAFTRGDAIMRRVARLRNRLCGKACCRLHIIPGLEDHDR